MSTPPTQLMPCRAYEACNRHQACTARTARSRRKGSLAAGVPLGHPGVQRDVHKACPPLAHPSLQVMAGTGLTLGAPCLVLTGSVACAAATLGGAQWHTAVIGGASCPRRRALLTLPLYCSSCCCLHFAHALDAYVHVAVPNGHVGHFGLVTHSPRSSLHLSHCCDLPLHLAILNGHV